MEAEARRVEWGNGHNDGHTKYQKSNNMKIHQIFNVHPLLTCMASLACKLGLINPNQFSEREAPKDPKDFEFSPVEARFQ